MIKWFKNKLNAKKIEPPYSNIGTDKQDSGYYHIRLNGVFCCPCTITEKETFDEFTQRITTVFCCSENIYNITISKVELFDSTTRELVGLKKLPRLVFLYKGDCLKLSWFLTMKGNQLIS